jgi:hypothetical protein
MARLAAPVVFLILTYNQPALAERLIARLVDTDEAVTVVHHDATGTAPPTMPAGGRALLVPDPIAVGWGTMENNDAIVNSMRWIRREIPDYSWIVVISGQDYPVVHPRAIEAELRASQADVYMRWEFIPPFARKRSTDWQRGMSHRYYWRLAPGTTRPVPFPRLRSYFDGVGVFAGSNWSTFSRRAIDRIFDEPELVAYLRKRFMGTLAPSEAFFQTLVMNSPIGLSVVNDERRYYRFPETGDASHPYVLTLDDLDAILARKAWFARKIEEGVSDELLDRLDELNSAGLEAPARDQP